MIFARHPSRWLAPYAEGALPTAHAREVAAHVFGCRRCRRALELVRAGRDFASALAPTKLSASTAGPSWSELAPLLADPAPARAPAPRFSWALAAAAVMTGVVGTVAWRAPQLANAARGPSDLETSALAAHRAATFELGTDDDQRARRWIADSAAVTVSLPPSDQHRQLLGATRLGTGAVALSYRLGADPVTLVIGEVATDGDRKRITRRSEGALEVASWRHAGRSFALVSALRGATACSLCHATAGPAALL